MTSTYSSDFITNRIKTGIAKQSIYMPNKTFYGNPDDFKFKSSAMVKYYAMLKGVFARNGLDTTFLGVETKLNSSSKHKSSNPDVGLVSFVLVAGTSDCIKFIWQKYEGYTSAGGQNHLFANGRKIKMTAFAAMTDDEQDIFVEPVEMRRIMRKIYNDR